MDNVCGRAQYCDLPQVSAQDGGRLLQQMQITGKGFRIDSPARISDIPEGLAIASGC